MACVVHLLSCHPDTFIQVPGMVYHIISRCESCYTYTIISDSLPAALYCRMPGKWGYTSSENHLRSTCIRTPVLLYTVPRDLGFPDSNTGAQGTPVIILCALSFSPDFDRGTYRLSIHMSLFTNKKRNLGHIKLLQAAPQQLDYRSFPPRL